MGRRLPCAIGRAGIGHKEAEGDGLTPIGRWTMDAVFVRRDRCGLHGIPISPDLWWGDDPRSSCYNMPFRGPRPGFSAERMMRGDPLYDIVAVLGVNRDPIVPGRGSAIFLHVWRKPRHPTEGCIGLSRLDLIWVLRNWTAASRVIVRAT